MEDFGKRLFHKIRLRPVSTKSLEVRLPSFDSKLEIYDEFFHEPEMNGLSSAQTCSMIDVIQDDMIQRFHPEVVYHPKSLADFIIEIEDTPTLRKSRQKNPTVLLLLSTYSPTGCERMGFGDYSKED